MEKIWFPIVFTTVFMVFVNIIPFLGVAPALLAFLLLLSPALVIWMVLKTLKDGIPSEKTFETHWYEDQNV
jgi:hypothetical protein